MAMPTSMPRPCFFIVSTSETPCGVEDFARKMAAALRQNEPDGGYDILPVFARWNELPRALREMAKADRIVFSLPLVAWKRTIALSWVLVLCAFFRRQKIFVYLHEWSSLHPLRRLVFIPFVLLSKTIIFLSPYIRSQFTADRWVRWASGKSTLALHAPTIRRPESRRVTEIVSRVKKLKRDKSIVIGQFGAIYKGKGTDALLDVCAYLCGQNVDASVVFVGGMTKSLDGYGDEFLNKVNTLKLDNRVIVTGYVDSDEELFAIFDLIDVFLYIFPEGLTARRSSVLASLQAGRPVVVSEPTVAGEFSHHEGYTSLVENGAIVFFPSSATVEDLAGKVMSVARQPSKASTLIDYDAWWKRASQKAAEMLEGRTR